VTQRFTGKTADVAINYLTLPESAEALAGEVRAQGRKALLCRTDVSDQPAVEAMLDRVVAELGGLDLLVIADGGAIHDLGDAYVIPPRPTFRRPRG
jgi:NAD(P)-dependent dehydrogenase (short-subunit alcohol dehydrogenase family)